MSSLERQIAPMVVIIKQEITDLDAGLRDLNLQFQGDRKKKDYQKDPEYLAKRSPMLDRRRLLSARQNAIRKQLRRY